MHACLGVGQMTINHFGCLEMATIQLHTYVALEAQPYHTSCYF